MSGEDYYAKDRAVEKEAEAHLALANAESMKAELTIWKAGKDQQESDNAFRETHDQRKVVYRMVQLVCITVLLVELFWLVLG